MQVNSTGGMQQSCMQKMDGSSGGQDGGMKEMMQSLSPEDRTAVREQMASLSEADRKTMKDQMRQLDRQNLSSDTLTQTLMEMLASFQKTDTTVAQTTLSTYT